MDLQLNPPAPQFSSVEQDQIAEILSMPVVKKYLEHLLWQNLVVVNNISMDLVLEEGEKHLLRVAFAKGSINTLHTLLTIQKSTKRN